MKAISQGVRGGFKLMLKTLKSQHHTRAKELARKAKEVTVTSRTNATTVRLMVITTPNPQKDKNLKVEIEKVYWLFLCGVQSGISREQNKGLTTI